MLLTTRCVLALFTLLSLPMALVAGLAGPVLSHASEFSRSELSVGPAHMERVRSSLSFFDQKLDQNHDGHMDASEYQFYLEHMDPSEMPTIPWSAFGTRFKQLDLNGDGLITPEELCIHYKWCERHEIAGSDETGIDEFSSSDSLMLFHSVQQSVQRGDNVTTPIQIHLSASVNYSTMWVSWTQNTQVENLNVSVVRYGTVSGGPYDLTGKSTWQTYTVFNPALNDTYTSQPLLQAPMTGLKPLTQYFYIVGNPLEDTWSLELNFTSLPDLTLGTPLGASTRFLIVGDMGTNLPMGATVFGWAEEEHQQNPFQVALHLGDLSYAGFNWQLGEIETTWDAWVAQISPLASIMPYMTSVGNHENFFNYTSYDARFRMPGEESKGNKNFWWSFDYGNIHFTSWSTEHSFEPGSPQYEWIESDLLAARSRPSGQTTWLIMLLHRPMLNSDIEEWKDHCPGSALLEAMEPLMQRYKVDLAMQGHMHEMERTFPYFNGSVINSTTPTPACGSKRNDPESAVWNDVDPDMPLSVFAEPNAPVYYTQGASGAMQLQVFLDQPAWSAWREWGTWGYSVMTASTSPSGCASLLLQMKTEGGKVLDQFIIQKDVV